MAIFCVKVVIFCVILAIQAIKTYTTFVSIKGQY
jgi:hypothetical protein